MFIDVVISGIASFNQLLMKQQLSVGKLERKSRGDYGM
jgi:hypothetical protein